ncbi:SDR family NAD(P)-dependent oxidoreductase [Rhodococcus sp. 27YEA15]|uniref:SDR family NAD(P)-dependent oxidoreductase n=1 Tax=Rhodococcus sp. 27YEA15 TaxID=3156259 RepID=UPI003C7C7BC2
MDSTVPVRFDGKTVIVTGAGRGLGREFAALLGRLGANVVVNDIGVAGDAERYAPADDDSPLGEDAFVRDVADRVAAEIGAAGGSAVGDRSDVAAADSAESLVERAVDVFGGIDGIIHCAGVVPFAPLEELVIDDLRLAHGVHVGGAFSLARAAWPHMRESGGGRILNVCSIEGVLVGNPSFTAYAAAKGGMMGLTRSLAAEGAPLGIGVNGLLPGATTRANAAVVVGYRSDRIDRSPALVAPVAAWLVHPESSVSGQFYAAAAGSVRRIFTSAARGYQSPEPSGLRVEEVRDNWEMAESLNEPMAPATAKEYNDFRMAVYRQVVTS